MKRNRYVPHLGIALAILLNAPPSYGQGYTLHGSISGKTVYAWNGISTTQPSESWGADLVYKVSRSNDGVRKMGPLGGFPLVTIYNETGGIAVFNTATHFEPFTVKIVRRNSRVEILTRDGSASGIETLRYKGDYFDAINHFALKMKAKGLFVQAAPTWAFDPIWETYGYEERWTKEVVLQKLPLLKELGIKTITLDSGWYGSGSENWEAFTGDYPVNPDVIGSEADLVNLINRLHGEGFRVRAWTAAGVAERDTNLYRRHPDWFLEEAVSSTETADWYLDPEKPAVKDWTRKTINRFLDFGFDGFKQDDIFQVISNSPRKHVAYRDLMRDIYVTSLQTKPDCAINSCNCGVAQNFYDVPGQNQLITSDPVGAGQFRHRAKYLHALNVNGAAILGDHIELTEGDVGPDDLDEAGFYDKVDFASVVALGMVLETKFRDDPGDNYRKWFRIYNKYKLYNKEWVNIPFYPDDSLESYLIRDQNTLYPSFFVPDTLHYYDDNPHELESLVANSYDGPVVLAHLTPGQKYSIYDISGDRDLGAFTASGASHQIRLTFKRSVLLRLEPVSRDK